MGCFVSSAKKSRIQDEESIEERIQTSIRQKEPSPELDLKSGGMHMNSNNPKNQRNREKEVLEMIPSPANNLQKTPKKLEARPIFVETGINPNKDSDLLRDASSPGKKALLDKNELSLSEENKEPSSFHQDIEEPLHNQMDESPLQDKGERPPRENEELSSQNFQENEGAGFGEENQFRGMTNSTSGLGQMMDSSHQKQNENQEEKKSVILRDLQEEEKVDVLLVDSEISMASGKNSEKEQVLLINEPPSKSSSLFDEGESPRQMETSKKEKFQPKTKEFKGVVLETSFKKEEEPFKSIDLANDDSFV